MSEEPNSWRDTSNTGGVAGKHPDAEAGRIRVAPTFVDEINTIKDPLVVVACWRLEDIRFEFASSFIRPEVTDEFAKLVLNCNNTILYYNVWADAQTCSEIGMCNRDSRSVDCTEQRPSC